MRGLLVVGLAMLAGCGKGKPTEADEGSATPAARLVAPGEKYTTGALTVAVKNAVTDGDHLVVVITTYNDAPGSKPTLGKWETGARAIDSLGTICPVKPVTAAELNNFAAAVKRGGDKGEVGPGPVYSDRPRAQFIRISRPVVSAEYLDLDLDAKTIGEVGTIRFRIPADVWKKK